MFLVEKTHLTSHFKLIGKKSSPISKSYQLTARSFDEKVNFHIKNLIPASNSSIISLSWMSKAVTFISTIHFEAQAQISNFRSESDYSQDLYMDYSQKVLDLSNLITSAVKQLIERRLLLNLSLRLIDINSSGQIPAPEKLKKAKDALTRSVHCSESFSQEKAQRAKDLLGELSHAVNSFPTGDGKTSTAKDLIRRTLHALGALTVFVAGVLVSVLYGQSADSDPIQVRVPAEFLFADSVHGVQKQISDLIKPKQQQASDAGDEKRRLQEVEDTVNRALAVCDVIDDVAVEGGEKHRVRLEDVVKALAKAVAEFSGVVDELTNGVNGLFSSVLKTRNGVLDGVRKGDW